MKNISIETLEIKKNDKNIILYVNLFSESLNIVEPLWFSFPISCEDAIVTEVCDGVLIAIATFCSREKINIKSKVPATLEMLKNLETLISLLAQENPTKYSIIEIEAPVLKNSEDIFPCKQRDWIFSSASCGVDALHTIHMSNKSEYFEKITHLIFNNTGSNNVGRNPAELLNGRIENSSNFCRENGYVFLFVDSNFSEMLKIPYMLSHTYVNVAIGFFLAKKAKEYFYSSGYAPSVIHFDGSPAHYEMALFNFLYSSYFRVIHIPGDFISRFFKIKNLIRYSPANKFLNVCLYFPKNCGKCEKCRRVFMALECYNAVEQFNDCFDIEEYQLNKDIIWRDLIIDYWNGNEFVKEMWIEFHHKLKIKHYFLAYKHSLYIKILGIKFLDTLNQKLRHRDKKI